MSEFLLSDIVGGMSAAPESAVNTPYTLSADFLGMKANGVPPPVPGAESIDDSDMIMGGSEFADDVWLYNWLQNPYSFGGKLNTETAARWFLRALMGTITDAVVTATKSWDHSVVMQTRAQGRTPKYTTVVLQLGGANFLFCSMAVNSFSISQNGTAVPQFQCEVIGTGKYQKVSDISPALIIPAPVQHNYMHGAACVLTLNNGSTVNLSTLGRIRSWSFGLQNNLVTGDRRPGDPFMTANDVTTGSYVRSLLRGKRSVSAQIKLSLDENLSEFDWLKSGTTITSLKVKNVGKIIGTSTDSFEFELTVPKSKIQVITGDSEGDDATITINFLPLRDPVSGGLITGRVRNDAATMA